LDDPSVSCQIDEFYGGVTGFGPFEGTVGSLGWSTNSQVFPSRDYPNTGVINFSAPIGSVTPSNTLNTMRLSNSLNSVTPGPFFSDSPLRMKWILRRSFGNPTTWRVGFMDTVTGTPANGMYFEARGGEWWAIQRSNNVSVEIDTGKPESGNYQQLEIRRNAATGATEFYINNLLKASENTNHPNITLPLNLAIQLGGQGDVLIDYVSICLTGLQRNLP
jgi:hypothetical protein